MYNGISLLERCFRGFVLPVLEYCSAFWCSAADKHLKLLDHAVSGERCITGRVFECDIAHRRSVSVLCMLYKTRGIPMHPRLLCSTWTVCASSGYTLWPGRTSVYLFAALLQNLTVPEDFCSPLGFQEPGQCYFIGLSCSIPTIVFHYFSRSLLSVYMLVLSDTGLRTHRVHGTLSQPRTADLY